MKGPKGRGEAKPAGLPHTTQSRLYVQFRQPAEIDIPPASAQKGPLQPSYQLPPASEARPRQPRAFTREQGHWPGFLHLRIRLPSQGHKPRPQPWWGEGSSPGQNLQGSSSTWSQHVGAAPWPPRASSSTHTGLRWGQSKGSPWPQAPWDRVGQPLGCGISGSLHYTPASSPGPAPGCQNRGSTLHTTLPLAPASALQERTLHSPAAQA